MNSQLLINIEKYKSPTGDGIIPSTPSTFPSCIEKYKSPTGDGMTSGTSSQTIPFIEKYKSPTGDGMLISFDHCVGVPLLRNISPRQGTECKH